MDGSPQLLTDVKFTQLKRGGYDPDQVDNFLERVSAAVAQLQDKLRVATERAEAADAQIAEARRLQAEAEGRAGGAGSTTGADGAPATAGGDEEITKVLLLAQRAADQAVEEANANATRTMADARAKAVNLLAEAEQERDRLLAKARKKADAAAEERARQLQERVEVLAAARAELEGDLDALQTHLDRERVLFQERLESVQRALDDPRGFRLAPTPALSDPVLPAPDADDEADDEVEGATATDTIDADTSTTSDDDGTDTTDAITEVGSGGDEPEAASTAQLGSDRSTVGQAGSADQSVPASDTAGPFESRPGVGGAATAASSAVPPAGAGLADGIDSGPDAGSVAVMTATDGSSDDLTGEAETASDGEGDMVDLTSQRLFGDVSEQPANDSGPATQAYTPTDTTTAPEPATPVGDSPLGEPDAEADAAMRAFFDADMGDSSEPAKTRFGRRR